MAGSFTIEPHTADVAVSAKGDSMAAVFEAVADGLASACAETVPSEGGSAISVTITEEDPERLLYAYLAELIYERDVREVLPVDNHVEIITTEKGYRLEVDARGVGLDAIEGREIKAVTYSEMRLENVGDAWEAYVVFDV